MTLRALPEPDISLEIDGLLIAPDGPEATHEARAADPADDASADPSSVPVGEPWLQLVCEPAATEDDSDCDGGEQRAA